MQRHATYRQDHPWLSTLGEFRRAILRPSRLLLTAFLLAVAAKAGAPVHRAIPQPVKAVYADVNRWQDGQEAAAKCVSGRKKAIQSGTPQHFAEAERRCAEAAALHER